MITCRSPWQKAVTMDDCFSDFLLEENYLREMLPISKSANTLFRKIFAYDPMQRITIPALRKEIVELDTFFMSDEEISRSGRAVRVAASYCGHKATKAKKEVKEVKKVKKVEKKERKEDVVASPRIVHEPVVKLDDVTAPVTTTEAFIIGTISADSDDSEISPSSSESDGPVTPQDSEEEILEFNIKLDDEERLMDEKPPLGLRVVNGPLEAVLTA